MKKTQIKFITDELLTKGEISRNHCLRNYISRLSARILDLEKDGWVFTTEKREGDFVYKASHIPNTNVEFKKVDYSIYKIPENWSEDRPTLGQLSLI